MQVTRTAIHLVASLTALAFASASGSAGVIAEPAAAMQPVKPAADPVVQDRIRKMIATAWDDASVTWDSILGSRLYEREPPQINFVTAVRASHCYGLYISAGPVYCFGNNTVFVSLDEMQRLDARITALGEPGLVFLVAHELGHHVQKITGRFRALQALVRSSPWLQRELSLRFELEADCLAGVWAGKSKAFEGSSAVRTGILASLDAIGDDKVQQSAASVPDPSTFTHGTSAQRTHWFKVGIEGGTPEACSVLEATELQ
jgi:uncharacterized protein